MVARGRYRRVSEQSSQHRHDLGEDSGARREAERENTGAVQLALKLERQLLAMLGGNLAAMKSV